MGEYVKFRTEKHILLCDGHFSSRGGPSQGTNLLCKGPPRRTTSTKISLFLILKLKKAIKNFAQLGSAQHHLSSILTLLEQYKHRSEGKVLWTQLPGSFLTTIVRLRQQSLKNCKQKIVFELGE